jgi:aldose 1-epimerase
MNTKLNIGLILASMALCMGQATPPAAPTAAPAGTFKRIEESDFGKLPDGTAIKAFTLTNAKGMKARVITYGAVIAGIQAPDKDGKLVNVVATPDDAAATPRFGQLAYTVGRYANRIGNGGKFTLDGTEITLPSAGRGFGGPGGPGGMRGGPGGARGPATGPGGPGGPGGARGGMGGGGGGQPVLHSGAANFGTKVWEGKALEPKATEASAQLTYFSKDGDGGFPGNLTLKLTYTLNDNNEFTLAYEATTDKTTVINVTNHAYFNLAGAAGFGFTGTQGPIADEELWVDSDKILATQNLVPTGQFTDVVGTPFDFNKPTVIGSRNTTYDTPFVLKTNGKLATVARLRDPKSGREMEVRTDQPGLQVYTGGRTAIALESQHHPDSPNHPEFPTTTLKPGDTFKTTTIYAFSAK